MLISSLSWMNVKLIIFGNRCNETIKSTGFSPEYSQSPSHVPRLLIFCVIRQQWAGLSSAGSGGAALQCDPGQSGVSSVTGAVLRPLGVRPETLVDTDHMSADQGGGDQCVSLDTAELRQQCHASQHWTMVMIISDNVMWWVTNIGWCDSDHYLEHLMSASGHQCYSQWYNINTHHCTIISVFFIANKRMLRPALDSAVLSKYFK